jgi:hypothetical protein
MTWTRQEVEALIARGERELGPATDGDPDQRDELLLRLGWGTVDFTRVAEHEPDVEQMVADIRRIAPLLSMPRLEAVVREVEAARSDVLEYVAEGIERGELRYVD